jgi:Tol biopolymer transport system component
MTDRDGDWEVYIMDRDGGNPTNLTNSPGNDGVPVHAPGQARLAFISDRDNPSLDLFIMDLDGSNVANLTQSPEGNDIPITWSPGGEYLAFANDQSGVSEIYLIKTNGEGLINLSQRDNAQTFDDWSPSTDRLLVSASSEVGISPLITDPERNTPQSLTDRSFPAGGGRWSPDGSKIALMAMAPGTTTIDIFVLDLASGEMINLTQSPSSDRFPRWSPDGSKIAFVSDRDGNPEIYMMNADGSNLINLTNSPTVESIQGDFAWSPDGSQILFHTNRDGNLEIYVMNADGSNQVNLTKSPETDLNAIWVQQ